MRKTAEIQQNHIETLPLFSTKDTGGRMTVFRPGQSIGRAAPFLPSLLAAAVLWALIGSVPFGALLGLAPTSEINLFLGHPVTVVITVLLLFVAIGVTARLYSRAIEQFGQYRVAGLFATLAVTGGLVAVSGILLVWTLTSDPSRPFNLEAIATSTTIPLELGAVVSASIALWGIISLLRLSDAITHARGRLQFASLPLVNKRSMFNSQILRHEHTSFILTYSTHQDDPTFE
ncbi:hypothetical protein NV379_17125 [Paenibacillus sp. N1-5-1-14]|uniref:hypothetical protein n=1 Tax=Paenibacillus radicibacter TaxID=2972488 RepID=UPI002158BFC8|nr:hypothetical protein [Paenibacillus radicibacter]MCR8644378.1 hypothetical protein [Paenibacillus radicibacter]